MKKLLVSTILSGSILFSIEAHGFTLDRERTALGRPWGYSTRGQEIIQNGYSMRDSAGNLAVSASYDQSRNLKGGDLNFYSKGAASGFGNSVSANGTKLIANEFNVITSGSFNTVLIENVQTTQGDLVLNGSLDEGASD